MTAYCCGSAQIVKNDGVGFERCAMAEKTYRIKFTQSYENYPRGCVCFLPESACINLVNAGVAVYYVV